MGVQSFLFGSGPDTSQSEADLEAARQQRANLAQIYGVGPGGQTGGEAAALRAGQTQAEQLFGQAQGQAAGARGFARVGAQDRALSAGLQAGQQVMAGAADRAAQARMSDAQGALGLAGQSLQAGLSERELEELSRSYGLMPAIMSAGGAVLGGLKKGPEGIMPGASAGGTLGTGLSQAVQGW